MRDGPRRWHLSKSLLGCALGAAATGCPVADHTHRALKALAPKASQELGTIATTRFPHFVEHRQLRFEGGLPDAEDICPLAADHLTDQFAAMAGAAHDFLPAHGRSAMVLTYRLWRRPERRLQRGRCPRSAAERAKKQPLPHRPRRTLDSQSGRDQGRQTQNARHGADSLRETAPIGQAKSSDVSQTQFCTPIHSFANNRRRSGPIFRSGIRQ